MVELAYGHGLRRGEVAVVHSRDITPDGVGGWLLLVHGKGRRFRRLPLQPQTARALRALPPGWVFPGGQGGHLAAGTVGRLVAGVLPGGWTAHSLRHGFATDLWVASGGDLFTVQQALGHARPETTEQYILPSPRLLRGAMGRLGGPLHEGVQPGGGWQGGGCPAGGGP